MPGETARGGASTSTLAWLTLGVVALVSILGIGGQLLNPGARAAQAAAVELNFAAAFLGGVFAFLSPCSVAIVPGFFAYSFDTRGSLLRHTYVFYLGLALVFVPLGFGASVVGDLLRAYQQALVLAAGILLIALGLPMLVGRDPLAWLLPHAGVPSGEQTTTTARVLLLGALFGLATSTCTAPILAGITVLSVGSGLAPFASIGLFLVFALGIAAPLFGMAWVGDRTAYLERLRGGRFTLEVAGRRLRLQRARVAAGLMLVALGVLFLATSGTRDLLALYDAIGATTAYEEVDAWVRAHLGGWRGWALTVAAFLLAVGAWWRGARREDTGGPHD